MHHSAPKGQQQNCLHMYERDAEEREVAQSVATDTANGETEESGGRATSRTAAITSDGTAAAIQTNG